MSAMASPLSGNRAFFTTSSMPEPPPSHRQTVSSIVLDPMLSAPAHQIVLVVNGIYLLENLKLSDAVA
jgi:hypothetical protein